MENRRQEKPRTKEKNNPLCQKLVQKGRALSGYNINPLEPIHHPHIYMGEKKKNKAEEIYNFFFTIYIASWRFRVGPIKEIRSPSSNYLHLDMNSNVRNRKNKLQSSTKKNSSPLPQTPKGNSITNTNQVQTMLKLGKREYLHHHISRIIMGANFGHNNITMSNDITHKMIPHINVLCLLIKHLIFCEENSTLWQSQKTMVIFKLSLSSLNSPFNQIASLQASIIAMYSASIVDKATIVYKVAFQLIAQPPIVKTYPIRDLLLSRSPAKS